MLFSVKPQHESAIRGDTYILEIFLTVKNHNFFCTSPQTRSRGRWLTGKESTANAGDAGSIPGRKDPLEKEMSTHSSILAWEISWTEEAGRLPSMRLQSQK